MRTTAIVTHVCLQRPTERTPQQRLDHHLLFVSLENHKLHNYFLHQPQVSTSYHCCLQSMQHILRQQLCLHSGASGTQVRVAAVNGALYILRQPVRKLLLDPDQQQCLGIETETGQVIRCSAFAASEHLLACLTKQSAVHQEPQSEQKGAILPQGHSQPQGQQLPQGQSQALGQQLPQRHQLLQEQPQEQQLSQETPVQDQSPPQGQAPLQQGPKLSQHQQTLQPQCSNKSISRAICILDGPLQEGESQVLVVIPPQSLPSPNPNAIRVLQLGPAAAVCPSDRTVLHLSTLSSGQTAAEDLATAVSALTNTSAVFGQSSGQSSGMPSSTESSSSRNRQTQEQVASNINPAALLVVFFNQVCRQDQSDLESLPSNVVACSPPDVSLDPDSAVQHARASFAKLYPDDAFGASAGSSPDADSDDEALDALSGVLQSLDTT